MPIDRHQYRYFSKRMVFTAVPVGKPDSYELVCTRVSDEAMQTLITKSQASDAPN